MRSLRYDWPKNEKKHKQTHIKLEFLTCTNVDPESGMSKHQGSKTYTDCNGEHVFPFPVFENTIYLYLTWTILLEIEIQSFGA